MRSAGTVGIPGPVDTKTGKKKKTTSKGWHIDNSYKSLMFYNSIYRSVNKALCCAVLFAKFAHFLVRKTVVSNYGKT